MTTGLRGALLAGGVVIATVVGAAGIAADAAGASAPNAVSVSYTCVLPSGSYLIGVQIAAAVAPGADIGPVRLRVTTPLPREALGAYSGPVRVAELLTVTEASAPSKLVTVKPVTATWPTSAASSIPAAGGWSLTTSGTIPATAARRPGTVTFTAGRLAIVMSLGAGSVIRASCTPDRGGARIAAQAVTAGARPAKVRVPAGCGHIRQRGNGVPTCAYVTGYADVAKLIGAALLQPLPPAKPGLANVDFAERFKFVPGNLIVYSTGQLYYRGRHELPPVTATFLAFGFVPVSATLHLTELGFISIVSVSGRTAPPFPITVNTATRVSLHITNVRVNGVPLDVGPGCGTDAPLRLVLVAHGDNTSPPRGYTLPTGGALSGKVTIPPFTHCGVTENLDPLLTGSISGRGNFVKLTQGKLCGPSQPQNFVCPPPAPKPQR